jgi:hypothetical protein
MGMTAHYIGQIVWAQTYPWYVVEVMRRSVVVTDCSEDPVAQDQVWTTEFMFDELQTKDNQVQIDSLKKSLIDAQNARLYYGSDLISDLIK